MDEEVESKHINLIQQEQTGEAVSIQTSTLGISLNSSCENLDSLINKSLALFDEIIKKINGKGRESSLGVG